MDSRAFVEAEMKEIKLSEPGRIIKQKKFNPRIRRVIK
jgi:hypothetical protein